MQDPTDSDKAPATRGEQKRVAQELQNLGMEILKITPADWKYFTLPAFVKEALTVASSIDPKNRGALRRQHQRIGSLMIEMDPEKLREEFRLYRSLAYGPQAAVSWAERLVQDDSAMTQFCETFPEIDFQNIRQMVRACRNAKTDEKKSVTQSKLVRSLRKSGI